MKKSVIALITVFCFSVFAFGAIISWKINTDDAKIGFNIKNAGLNVEGNFSGLEGTINFDPKNPVAGNVTVSVDASTINTGINLRDNNLKKEDYFDVENYPVISFQSSQITRTTKGFNITGTFTVKNVSKTIEVPFTFSDQIFRGSFAIDRLDFEVGSKSWLLGNEVIISFEIPVSSNS